MSGGARKKIVLLGMMSKLRVAGAVWQNLHYLLGLRRLGYDVYYVEAHGCLPWAFKENELEAAAFIDSVMRRFDMAGCWAFHARSGSGRYYGMSEQQVRRVYSEAAAVFNLHGGTVPAAEHLASERFVYIDTDPTAVQIEIHEGVRNTLDLLEPHCAFFTFGENYGAADCKLPVSERFPFRPTRQPVVLDLWDQEEYLPHGKITTIGNWQQLRRVVVFQGEEYLWSKHYEFLKFVDLPKRTTERFELGLSNYDEAAKTLLEDHGWEVRDASTFSLELDPYRHFIRTSRAEFTVAKDQNIRLRTGWFSDRSATYLAAGRPVITQETGFSNVLPTGQGLFAFSTTEDILSAIEEIGRDYDRHSRAAREIAREYFSYDVVLARLLSEVGLGSSRASKSRNGSQAGPWASERQPCLVNVIGHLSSNTGLGATARRYAGALESAGAAVHLIDLNDMPSSLTPSSGAADRINLICCDVASQSTVLTRMEEEVFRQGYNIGLWLWELPTLPAEWHDRFAYYDEIWAPTSFLASAFARLAPVPVVTIPHVLEPEASGIRQRGRERLGLEPEDFTFAFIFDFHSRFERKNPLAVIDSFKAAFKPDDGAHLIVKCTHPDFSSQHFAEMIQRASGHRISIYTEQWPAVELLDLIAACDCYVSLHRAEGVGLTISDAMAAGKPVVATGWSGNMEFMNVSNSFPVRYRLVTLDRDVAHYRAGDVWAEPSLEHATEVLRYVFDHRAEAAERGQIAKQEITTHYSNHAVATVLASRLALIGKRHQFSRMQRRLRAPIPDLDAFLHDFAALGEYVPAHQLRYQDLKERVRRVVQGHVPPESTVLVVSKGDDELIDFGSLQVWHFPQGAGGKYAGHHPRDSAEAIRHLEELRAEGGDFLVFPNTSMWWLEHYGGFRDYLQRYYSVTYSDDYCMIFGLSGIAKPEGLRISYETSGEAS